MSVVPPTPTATAILGAIRSTAAALTAKSLITINDAAISTFLTTMDSLEWSQELTSSQGGIRLPLRFSSPIEELNFISTLSLLNCLSGHRAAFHRLTSRGAYSTLLSLLLSSYLSPLPTTPLTTSGMCASSPASLASLAQIMTHTEKDHPTMGPIVKIGEKDEEAWEILESWTKVLKETGTILKVLKYESLGEWVAETLGETGGDAGAFLVELVDTFPAFRDAYEIDGEPVYIYKKALFLINSISSRWTPRVLLPGEIEPEDSGPVTFPIPSSTDLPIFADNVIPTLLIHYSILTLPSSLPLPLPSPLSAAQATILRAASITACARICAKAREEGRDFQKVMTEVQLDGYLWNGGKKGTLRDLERMSEKGTIFY